MPTIVTSSIGTNSRDYSTIQAWEDACPSDLVAADQVWKGECYNDSEFTGGVSISGQTTDATRYVWLTAAGGESFIDHADAATNPLTYDQSKGVGIAANPAEVPLIDVYATYTKIERLQIKRSGWSFGHPSVRFRTTGSINNCLIENSVSAPSGGYTLHLDEGSKAENCCIIARTNNQHGIGLFFFSIADSCTVVCDSAAGESGGIGINDVNGNATAKNCAIFGFATPTSGSFNASSDYNATDKASGLPGSNSLYNLTFADQFENTSTDFRLKAGADLIDAGSTALTTDIIGQTRGSPPDIGAWEYVASGGGTSYTINPAGGVNFTGTVDFIRARVQAPSGAILFGGSAALTKTKVFEPSGGLTLSGEATPARGRAIGPAGGVLFSGGSAITFVSGNSRLISPSGGVGFGGAADYATHEALRTITPDGGATFSGAAPMAFHETIRTITPGGGLMLSGHAAMTGPGSDEESGGGITRMRARRVPMESKT
jgi:hypothetical protein